MSIIVCVLWRAILIEFNEFFVLQFVYHQPLALIIFQLLLNKIITHIFCLKNKYYVIFKKYSSGKMIQFCFFFSHAISLLAQRVTPELCLQTDNVTCAGVIAAHFDSAASTREFYNFLFFFYYYYSCFYYPFKQKNKAIGVWLSSWDFFLC